MSIEIDSNFTLPKNTLNIFVFPLTKGRAGSHSRDRLCHQRIPSDPLLREPLQQEATRATRPPLRENPWPPSPHQNPGRLPAPARRATPTPQRPTPQNPHQKQASEARGM